MKSKFEKQLSNFYNTRTFPTVIDFVALSSLKTKQVQNRLVTKQYISLGFIHTEQNRENPHWWVGKELPYL